MPVLTEEQRAFATTLAQEFARAAGREVSDFVADGEKYGPDVLQMIAEGATPRDLRVPARVLAGELAIRGINIQAAGERGLKAVLHILWTAGRAALGLP